MNKIMNMNINSNNGFVYVRQHKYYENDKICKLGKSKNIPDRDNSYATGEYRRGKFGLVIEILNDQLFNDTYVEKLLQRYFKNYHSKIDGGSEFYQNKIIDEIVPFLSTTKIKFKVLTVEEINNLIHQERIRKLKDLLKTFFKNRLSETKENRLRNKLQEIYLVEIINELNTYKKVFLKAPTGFGKTHIYYKTIQRMKFNRILFLTPRILLNQQIVEDKYSSYIKDDNYKIIHFSDLDNSSKEETIKKYSKNNIKIIMTSCYQSRDRLLDYIKKYKFLFDLIIFDEAHFITSWADAGNISEFLSNNDICKYRLFGSATPTYEIEGNSLVYGKVIEKVKVYELLNKELLCNIETIVKQLNEKKAVYHNLKDLIVESMTKYTKKKGIIYVNDSDNAVNLFNLLKTQNIINAYLYISKNVDVENDSDTDIKEFEKDEKQCVIVCIDKIGYGYDNDFIDFICLGDPRQSDIDIRQIIGRGLRWKKDVYPNKLLHLLVPLYKDEFGNCAKNEHLKKYLDYIIGECGQDIIFKSNGNTVIGNGKQNPKESDDYDGEKIQTEILNEYCTTGYNKYSDFMKFLKSNKIYDELSYNKLKEKQNWIIDLGGLQTKYPKFCFQEIHPNNRIYYSNKKEANNAYYKLEEILIEKIGIEKYKRYDQKDKIEKINELDNKIPIINFDLYYSKD
jgi:superfamily II DNA or RNA helicase